MAFSKSASTSLLLEESVKSTSEGLAALVLFNLLEPEVGEFGGWLGGVNPALETGGVATWCGVFLRLLSAVTANKDLHVEHIKR